MKIVQLSILLFFVTLFISSCTLVRTVRYLKPSTLDHEKVFACDTVKRICYEKSYASVGDAIPSAKQSVFTNANDANHIPAIEKWIPPAHKMEATDLDDFLEKSKTTAFLVIKNDSILYQKYLNGGEPTKARIVFSVTKAVIAILTAIAEEEGLIDINQKVADFIPEFGKDARKEITINHLLNMTSGLDWKDNDNVVKLGFLYYNKNQEKFIVKNAKLVHKPGTYHAYKSLSTQILGICLERATNRSVAAYLEEKIWQPMGMKNDAYVTVDSRKKHNTRAFGGIAMTASDMARFGKLLLNDGKWNQQQIIPSWFMKILNNREMDGANWGNDRLCFKRNGYEDQSYQNNQKYWASGYLGQYIFVDKKQNMLIVRQGDDEKTSWRMFMGRLTKLIGEGQNDLTNPILDFGDQFAGNYKTEEGQEMSFVVTEKDDFGRRNWTWTRDRETFDYLKKIETLYQHDGVSLGYSSSGHYTRLFADIKEGKVVGLYYNYTPSRKTLYFKKTN